MPNNKLLQKCVDAETKVVEKKKNKIDTKYFQFNGAFTVCCVANIKVKREWEEIKSKMK